MPGTDRNQREVAKPKAVRLRTVKAKERQAYYDARTEGAGKLAAAAAAGVDPKTARKWENAWLESGNPSFDTPKIQGPKGSRQLSPAARDALKDFSYFQERYLGRVSLPWQREAAETIVKLTNSPEREYVVANMPPGAGKSTLFTHDILCWLIAKNRGIRICILSSTQKNAEKFADRIRRTLEATVPIQAPEKQLRDGTAKDAQATLQKDFGRFKPEEATTWTKQKFFVDRPGEDESHKDATVEAYGKDQAFLGGRYDVVVCDDVYDPKSTKTFESKEEIKGWFADTAESRLEPSGLMLLVMQRVDPEDLSRFALDMVAYEAEDDEEVDEEELREIAKEKERLGIDPLPVRDGSKRKYRHLVYKSHFEEECKGAAGHKLSSPAWPEGCLLYPRRLSYRDLKTREQNDPGKFRVWYQQEDFEPGNVLAENVWIYGGTDEFGVQHPGCMDRQRSAQEFPRELAGQKVHSFLTVDPSPSQFWAIEWWIYHPESKQLYLIDLERRRMASPEFFDYDPRTGSATGILCDMVAASSYIGAPITHVVPERNAAQKFMFESSAIVQWLRSKSIFLMEHTTTAHNKNSQEFGVQSLQTWFKEGRLRLPARQDDVIKSRTRSLKLIDEATRYRLDGTSSYYDDCIMACWFATLAVEKNFSKQENPLPPQWRPTWMRQRPNLRAVV